MNLSKLKEVLVSKGMKVTPQRLAMLEALAEMDHHPRAEEIIDFIRQHHPNIATGTVYNILETFVQNGIIQKVKTEKDIMRYDAILENHHHLYCAESDKIEDYFDEDLNILLKEYFKNKNIPDFEIEDINLQIKGKFKTN